MLPGCCTNCAAKQAAEQAAEQKKRECSKWQSFLVLCSSKLSKTSQHHLTTGMPARTLSNSLLLFKNVSLIEKSEPRNSTASDAPAQIKAVSLFQPDPLAFRAGPSACKPNSLRLLRLRGTHLASASPPIIQFAGAVNEF